MGIVSCRQGLSIGASLLAQQSPRPHAVDDRRCGREWGGREGPKEKAAKVRAGPVETLPWARRVVGPSGQKPFLVAFPQPSPQAPHAANTVALLVSGGYSGGDRISDRWRSIAEIVIKTVDSCPAYEAGKRPAF